jgi:RimJ/RimL family protein N-acetyltransferase
VLELRGDLVTLRRFEPDELDRLWAERLASGNTVRTPDEERFRERFSHSGEWHDGALDLAVEAGGRFIGSVGARVAEKFNPPGICEIGIALFPGERGGGRGTEAVRLLSEWLLDNGYPRVQASTDVRNAAMRRVFEKLGWELEGIMRAYMPAADGSRDDYALYAVTR